MIEGRKDAAQRALVTSVLEGEGRASPAQRRAAFENTEQAEPLRTLIDKVALRPTRVTDADLAAAKASGLDEDQVFELVVCAAIGQATRQYEAAREALAAAMGGDHAS
jgi:alkylhydroperoxidase family enzyme